MSMKFEPYEIPYLRRYGFLDRLEYDPETDTYTADEDLLEEMAEPFIDREIFLIEDGDYGKEYEAITGIVTAVTNEAAREDL